MWRAGDTFPANSRYWSTKLEYDYLGFGANTYALGGFGTTVNTHVQLVKGGVNYHLLPGGFFGWL